MLEDRKLCNPHRGNLVAEASSVVQRMQKALTSPVLLKPPPQARPLLHIGVRSTSSARRDLATATTYHWIARRAIFTDFRLLRLPLGLGPSVVVGVWEDPNCTDFHGLLRAPDVANPAGTSSRVSSCLTDASIQTAERYLGSRRNLKEAVNDRLGLEWSSTLHLFQRPLKGSV